MSDVIYVAALIAFFAVAALYVHFCDRIVGTGEPTGSGATDDNAVDDESLGISALGADTSEVTV